MFARRLSGWAAKKDCLAPQDGKCCVNYLSQGHNVTPLNTEGQVKQY